MDCMLCTKQFHTLSGLKAHVIAQHNYKTVKRKADGSNEATNRTSAVDTTIKYVCNICKRNRLIFENNKLKNLNGINDCQCDIIKYCKIHKKYYCHLPECNDDSETNWFQPQLEPLCQPEDLNVNAEEDLAQYSDWRYTKDIAMKSRNTSSESELEMFKSALLPSDFTTSTDLKVHEVCHDKFSCFACNAKFDSFEQVTQHRRRCKVKHKVVKPKTLTDILKERVAQKQAVQQTQPSHPTDAGSPPKSATEEKQMIEIEIDMKQVKDAVLKKENEIKKEQAEADYKRIETELESIFDDANEKPMDTINVKVKEEKGSDQNEATKSQSEDTIEDILSKTETDSLKVSDTSVVREHEEQNDKITLGEHSSSKETEEIDETESNMEVDDNVPEKITQDDKVSNHNEIQHSMEDNNMEIDASDNNNEDKSIEVNKLNETTKSEATIENCENNPENVKTESVNKIEVGKDL